jgi:hypothetical protein
VQAWQGQPYKAGDRTYFGQLTINNASYFTNNLYFDGTNWRTEIAAAGGFLSIDTQGFFEYQYAASGGTLGITSPATVLSATSTGLAVTGTLSATGQIRSSGAISTNSVGLALGYSGANVSLVGAWGSGGATRGILSFYLSDVAGTVGNEYMRLNDTGLAVTGALSATGTLSGGTSGTAYSFSGSAPAGTLALTSAGLLGVGTASPGTTLHVVTDGTYDPFRLQSTQSGYARSWTIGPNVGTVGVFAIRDSTAGANRLEIDTSGNLGLGVTPSAWDTIKPLQSGNGSFYGYSTTEMGVNQNMYYASGAYRYITSAVATTYRQISGVHSWHNAASGTAGNAISFTQAATLTANGNYLLGTTTEPTSRKSGNTYQAINSAVIEGTPYTTVSTTAVQLSRSSGVGLIAMVSGYNTSGGAQGTWLVLVGNGVAIVVSSSDATATTPIFAVSAGALTMNTTTGTLSVVAQIFTGA